MNKQQPTFLIVLLFVLASMIAGGAIAAAFSAGFDIVLVDN